MTPGDLTPDELLSTTRTVRKRLDLNRLVEQELLEECLPSAPTSSPAPGSPRISVSTGIAGSTRPSRARDLEGGAARLARRDLSAVDYVYLWADGIHVNIRLEEHKLCLLVMIDVRADGRKELIALADGYRESAESWADLLRDCARRGMRGPVLAVGDGVPNATRHDRGHGGQRVCGGPGQ
jgi:hypothetical protein